MSTTVSAAVVAVANDNVDNDDDDEDDDAEMTVWRCGCADNCFKLSTREETARHHYGHLQCSVFS